MLVRRGQVGKAAQWTLAAALAAFVSGCGAQSENFDDKDWTKQHGIQRAPWRDVESLFGQGETDADMFKYALNGVRHDLTLGEKAKPDTRCTCLDVVIGKAGDPRLTWAGKRPKVAGKDMVIAVRTDGSKCPGASDKRRPSIQAVEARGADVTIVIEELTYDRPQALGAVISKPGHLGHLYVRSANNRLGKLPYGRTVQGTNICRIDTDIRAHHQQIRAGRRF
jgi:hypothetical protein